MPAARRNPSDAVAGPRLGIDGGLVVKVGRYNNSLMVFCLRSVFVLECSSEFMALCRCETLRWAWGHG